MHRFFHLALLILLLTTACQGNAASTAAPTTKPAAFSTPTRVLPTATLTLAPTLTFNPTASPSPTATRIPNTPTPSSEPITTLLFTGVIVPARCVQAALDANGNPDYPYEEVKDVITGADLAIGVLNATMSDQAVHTGCTPTYQLVGSPQNADAAARAGFDLMSVATNHIKDCGMMKSWCDDVFFDTLDNLRRAGIQTVGGGKDLAEALQPVVITIHGIRFGFVALGDSKMNPVVFARQDHPGIAELTEEHMRQALAAARKISDVVIALPHWGSEDNFVPNWNQLEQARYSIAGGADLVVGNHTHVVQAIQEVNGIPVFYGLGNFVFDQGLRDHRQGVILLVKFQGAKYIGYELIPTHTDPDGRVHIAAPDEAVEILENIERASDVIH